MLPAAYLQGQFVQITPFFTHIIKTIRFSLVETCPNSVAYFKDSMSDLVAINASEKILALVGFKRLPVETKISEAHTLPSEPASPGLCHTYLLFFFGVILSVTKVKIPSSSDA